MGEYVKKKLYYLGQGRQAWRVISFFFRESNLVTTFIKHLYSPSLIGIIKEDM